MSARFFLRKRRKEIPAFAGMTSTCNAVRFPHTLFRGNDECLYGRSAKGSGAAKHNNSLLLLVIPAKAGIRLRRPHEENRTDMADDRPRIPAFAGMTSVCTVGAPNGSERQNATTRHYSSSFPRKRESVAAFPQGKTGRYCGQPPPDSRFRGNDECLYGRSAEGSGAAKRNNSLIILRHSRESGNLSHRPHKENRTDMADDRPRIPAFAGMTSVCTVGAPKGPVRQNAITR